MENDIVTDADIMLVLDVVLSYYSFYRLFQKNELFKSLFKDSNIAYSFKCTSTKCSCMINFGLAKTIAKQVIC